MNNWRGPDPQTIQNLFGSIAHGYDQANDWMTFGMARLWRSQVVRLSGVSAGSRVLDCATGTGDLAIEFAKVTGAKGEVVGTDFCQEMLERAPEKARKAHVNVKFLKADVTALPFPQGYFDCSSIAYGIRNVQNPVQALSEMARVVKPGGLVMVLETGDAPNSTLSALFRVYFSQVVPRLGGWITGRRQAYEYLNQSSTRFPSRERFLEMMRETKRFSHTEYRALFFGASFLYLGVVGAPETH